MEKRSIYRSLLQNSAKAVLALVELLSSLVLEAMRSLFRQWVASASPWFAVFDHAATIPSEFTQVFNFPMAMLPK
jgi:hypothetical protein